MAEVVDRLLPRDGLNSYNIVLARVDLQTRGSVGFAFAITSALLPVTELHVDVPATGQSLDRMTVEAHDGLIDILRQLMFRADVARSFHERNAGGVPTSSAPANEGSPDVFRLGDGAGLRINGLSTGPESRSEPELEPF